MILDIEKKTVTVNGTLTLSQLWGIIDILDDDIDSDVNRLLRSVLPHDEVELAEPMSFERAVFSNIEGIHLALSDNKDYSYVVVRFTNGTTACSCEDWIYRRSVTFSECKHASRLRMYGVF